MPKKLVKDIGMFSVGTLTLGATSTVVGNAFPGYGGGLSAMAGMMPIIGHVTMLKHTVSPLAGLVKKSKGVKLK